MTEFVKWIVCQFFHKWEPTGVIDMGRPFGTKLVFWCPQCQERHTL